MRISDWSSDVCSSDLPPISQAEIGLGAHFHVGKFLLARLLERPQVRTGSAWIIATCAAGGEGAFEGGGVAVGATIAPPTDDIYKDVIVQLIIKIGITSCRDRVCQTVMISWGARALKKNKN